MSQILIDTPCHDCRDMQMKDKSILPTKKYLNGYYVDIMPGENCRQFRLLTWTSIISQFVHPVGEEGMG